MLVVLWELLLLCHNIIYAIWLFVCLLVFYGVSTFVGYSMPNSFLYKLSVLFQTIQFSISTQFVKTFLLQAIQFSSTVLIQTIQLSISIVFVYTQLNVKSVLFQTIHFSVNTISMSKTVLFQTIKFSIQKLFYFKQFSLA